jgi:hypothetical protein
MKKIILGLIFSFTMLFSSSPIMAEESSVFGEIEAPAGVAELNTQAGEASNNIGLLIFVSNMIKVASIVAGIWVLFNFIFAGFTYISASGDSGAYSKIGEKLALSATGLLLIVAAYTIAGILGLLIFGDATYIINPQIPTVIGT